MTSTKFYIDSGYWTKWLSERTGESMPAFLETVVRNSGYPHDDPKDPFCTKDDDNEVAAQLWRRTLAFFEQGTPVDEGLPSDWRYESHRNMYTELFESASSPQEIVAAALHVYAYYRHTGGNITLNFRWAMMGLATKLGV